MIKRFEGSKYNSKGQMISYYDKVPTSEDERGTLTAGYGHKVLLGDKDVNGKPITKEGQVISTQQADAWFEGDFARSVRQASGFAGFELMSDARQKAMVDLTFNMGVGWTNKFPKCYGNLTKASTARTSQQREYYFQRAAEELRFRDADDLLLGPSKYSMQTKGRAVEISNLVERGR